MFKIFMFILLSVALVSCGNEKQEYEEEKEVIVKDSVEVEEEPEGFKSIHQQELEEHDEDSSDQEENNNNEEEQEVIRFD